MNHFINILQIKQNICSQRIVACGTKKRKKKRKSERKIRGYPEVSLTFNAALICNNSITVVVHKGPFMSLQNKDHHIHIML